MDIHYKVKAARESLFHIDQSWGLCELISSTLHRSPWQSSVFKINKNWLRPWLILEG